MFTRNQDGDNSMAATMIEDAWAFNNNRSKVFGQTKGQSIGKHES